LLAAIDCNAEFTTANSNLVTVWQRLADFSGGIWQALANYKWWTHLEIRPKFPSFRFIFAFILVKNSIMISTFYRWAIRFCDVGAVHPILQVCNKL
jgi:hypothetical protein